MIKHTEPAKLLAYDRNGLIEEEHFGYIMRCDRMHIEESIGDSKSYPFYLRSCANPLQTALLIDYELDKKFDLTDEEIAICASTHAGEKIHTSLVQSILNKFDIPVEKLKCGTDNSLLHGCSGKHAMLLGICKANDWDIDNYEKDNHPLQKAIKDKIYQLCEVNTEYPISKDGHNIPIFSLPLKNIAKGYLNLFCDEKYARIKKAFLNHEYLIGGADRTDTKIITSSNNLIAKVSQGGLCVVVNPEIEEAFVIKMCTNDDKAREIVAIDLINNLHWDNIEISHDIFTLKNEKVGTIITLL